MAQTIPTWFSRIIIITVCVVIISAVGVGMGAVAVNGFLWSVGEVDDVQISAEENQTVNDINVYSEDHPVKIDVGDLVDAGAKFDSSKSAYDIKNGQQAESAEVFIEDAETTNATVIVNSSSLDSSETFDLDISNIDTTGVSSFEQNLSSSNGEIEYIAEQDGSGDDASFNIKSQPNVSIEPDSYNTETEEIELKSLELADNSSDYIVAWERSGDGDIKRQLGSAQGHKNFIKINDSDVEGETDIAVTVHPGDEEIQTETIYAADNSTIKTAVTVDLIQDPIYYNNMSGEDENGTETILFEFNTQLDPYQGNISIEFLNRSTSTIDIGKDTNKYKISGKYLRTFPYKSPGVNETAAKLGHIESVSVKNISAEVESNPLSQSEYNVKRVGKSANSSSNTTFSQGTNFGVLSDSSENISIVSKSQGKQYNMTEGASKIRIINTTEIPPGEYTLISDGENNGTQIEIINTSLSADIPVATAVPDVSTDMPAVKTERHLVFELYDENETIESISEARVRKDQESKITVEAPKTGDYELYIEDIDTGDTKSQSLQVLRKKNAKVQLMSDSGAIRAGNTVPIDLNSTYTNKSVKLLSSRSNSTAATINLSAPEKGNASISLNTYAAGNTSLSDAIVTTDDTVTVDSVETSTPNGTLPPGDYELAVHSEHGDADTENSTTFTLHNRSTNDLTPYTTGDKEPADLGTSEAIRSAITDTTLSPASTVSANQTVVYAVNASGLTGLPTAQNATLDTGADLHGFSGFTFGVQPTTSTELTTADTAESIGDVPNNSTVHVDDSRLYVVANGTDALGTDDPPNDGEEFTATFRVDDDHLRTTAADPSTDHTVTTTLTVTDPDEQLDSEFVDDEDDRAVEDGDRTPIDDDQTDGSAASGGPTGSNPTGGDPTESDAGPSPTEPPDSPVGGVTADPEAVVSYEEYGVAVRHVTSLQTPHPDAPAAIRVTPESDTADSDERATSTSTAQDQPRDSQADGDTIREPDAPGYDEAPIRSTAYDIPGFGSAVTLVSLLTASFLAVRRR